MLQLSSKIWTNSSTCEFHYPNGGNQLAIAHHCGPGKKWQAPNLFGRQAFEWTTECQRAWEIIKQHCMDASILIGTNVSNLAIGVMLAQNPTRKCDQLITYAFRLFDHTKKNYTPPKMPSSIWFCQVTSKTTKGEEKENTIHLEIVPPNTIMDNKGWKVSFLKGIYDAK